MKSLFMILAFAFVIGCVNSPTNTIYLTDTLTVIDTIRDTVYMMPEAPYIYLSTVRDSQNMVELKWYDVAAASGYRIYRAPQSGPYAIYSEVNVGYGHQNYKSETDSTMEYAYDQPDTSYTLYWYKVAVLDAKGNEAEVSAPKSIYWYVK